MKKEMANEELSFTSCPLTNISECDVSTKSQNFLITVYNPQSKYADYFVRVPVSGLKYTVKNHLGQKVKSQVSYV